MPQAYTRLLSSQKDTCTRVFNFRSANFIDRDFAKNVHCGPTYKVVWMVGPRKGQNFFSRLTLRDLALWSWASRSYGEVASPSEAWREADMAACAAVSLSLPGRHRSSQLYRDEQRRGHDRPSYRRESQPRSMVLIKTISRQKCQHCSAACESPRAYSTTVHGVLC